jgi:aspartate-semialdehyde dehydrogenase
MKPHIAIVGATGLVGSEMLTILESSEIEVGKLSLLASKNSEGELYRFRDDQVKVEELSADRFIGVDVALFALSNDLAEKYVPIAIEHGALVIDNSSRFRMDPKVPLVVPEVNGSLVRVEQKLFANPNCSTAQLVVALKPLHELAGLKRVVVSTYQSVSGAGKEALDELWAQSLAVFQQKDMPMEVFKHQIAFNLIPQIDAFLPSGYTKEEMKVINETRKILGLPNLRITCTAVRVPVFHSHSEAVSVDFERKVTKEEIIEALSKAPGIEVYTDEYPLPIDVTGTDPVHVGRIRVDDFGGCDFWIVADNLRKGAALNVVQILELWLQRKNVH